MTISSTGHVPDESWIDLLEGRASAAMTERMQSHLQAGCEVCTPQHAYWKRFLAAMERSRSVTPPAEALRRAFDLFETMAPRPSVWAQIVAHLVSDSRQQLIPAGARAGDVTSFNLVFEASDVSVSLWCESGIGSWQLTGQVLPAEIFWSVTATGGSTEIRAELDDAGEFRLPNLAPGQYQLALRGAEQEILIPDVLL